jgi:gliding motility-associated-like protein
MKYGFLFIVILLGSQISWATHNRAGEFRIEQIGDLTLRVSVITYTKTSSIQADRDTLTFFWGDGTFERVKRSNGNGQALDNDVKFNTYIAEHTYPGRATYTISMFDKNRVGNILNVNPPNSISIPFYVETTYTFLNPQFQGTNNSVILLQPPIDFACVGERFIHNPNAVDTVDNDSIAFELVIPLADSGLLVPKYSFPDQIVPGPFNRISLDPVTGDFVWDAPQAVGEYNIAIKVKEYRNGALISSVIRDMQILVVNCSDNRPPEIDVIDEICVVAGESLFLDVIVTDPNSNQLVKLSALGGPFILSKNPAILSSPSGYQSPPISAKFIWNTDCDHISDQYYSVIFKAVDNIFDTTGLATLKTLRIKVVGPAPEGVTTESNEETIQILWDKPYACDITSDDYFKGFSVWRKESSNQFEVDTCSPGLDGKGYQKIAFNLKDATGDKYFYEDLDVERGKTYCYRILGEFANTAASGLAFNRVESLPSMEMCIQLNRDVPLLTKISVDQTDIINGTMDIRWVKPLAQQLDTIQNPGPYRFVLMHDVGLDPQNFLPVPGADFLSPFFQGWADTTFLHSGLNTEESGHSYRVDFYTGNSNFPFGSSLPASSVYLSTVGTHESNLLSWEFNTPWDNFEFEVFRRNQSGQFESLGKVDSPLFEDTGLENGIEYCYQIKAIGTYGIEDIEDPLENLSQEACSIPMDDVPPCPPIIEVDNICDQANPGIPAEDIVNSILWSYPPIDCNSFDDISAFNIYYAPSLGADFEFVSQISALGNKFQFDHQPEKGIAGCYVVTSVDEIGNESAFSNSICVENCPFYELPNAFTPNNDGHNDIFKPFPYRFIDRIELKVFNRWGNLVFQTTDPDISWTGTNLAGQPLADGVYHYVCKVFESSELGNSDPSLLKGYIQLVSGSN